MQLLACLRADTDPDLAGQDADERRAGLALAEHRLTRLVVSIHAEALDRLDGLVIQAAERRGLAQDVHGQSIASAGRGMCRHLDIIPGS